MDKSQQTYDYIVVGTGPAGAVIAKTLTGDKKTSVLILESGDNNDQDRPIRDSEFALELGAVFSAVLLARGRNSASRAGRSYV